MLDFLNGIHNKIKFTCEMEEPGQINFLEMRKFEGLNGLGRRLVLIQC